MMRGLLGQLAAAVRALLVLSLLLGVGYPLLVTAVGQAVSADNANGSRVEVGGHVVGSDLIGQRYVDRSGAPLGRYFQPRPSAAGDGYDPTATAASNLGPENEALLTAVETRGDEIRSANAVGADGGVPADAVTASASGLDPHISPAYARLQVVRVAGERGLPAARVRALVDDHVQGRTLGFLGEPRVNVLRLNLALDRLK